jgi:hypothetical protein
MGRISAAVMLLLLTACGDDPPLAPAPPRPAPDDALDAIRAIAEDDERVRAHLAAWPLEAAGYEHAEATRVALTWRMRLALQDGEIEAAARDLDALRARFDPAEGVTPEGRRLSPEIMAGALVDEAITRARKHIDGPQPNEAGARRLIAIAENVPRGAPDAQAEARLDRARRWIALSSLPDLARAIGIALPAHEGGPRAIVLADDFGLGEAVFAGVLERWARDGAAAGMRVELVPIVRGQVRMGIRRVPAADRAEELAAIHEKARRHGIDVAGVSKDGIDTARLQALGLRAQDVAVLVLNDRGLIVARLTGRALDPRELDPVVKRLLSR